MQAPDFETERLRVRDWRADMAGGAFHAALEGVLTPAVLKTLPPSMQLSEGGVTAWVSALEGDAQVLAVTRQRRLVGLLILADAGDPRALHIGYLLAEAAWGKGYATELVQGLVDALSAKVCLIGGVGRDNPASAKVLQKAGFVLDPARSIDDTDMFVKMVG